MSNEPHWKGRGIAAAAVARKSAEAAKVPRNYVGDAIAALGTSPRIVSTGQDAICAAIIIAQALDRLGVTMTEAAAIANYKRAT